MFASRSRSFVLVFAVALGVLPAVPAAADAPVTSAAEALFNAGRDAMTAGRYDEACSKFEASNQLDRAAGTLFNLANCNEQRGRLALALTQFLEVQSVLPVNDARGPVAAERVRSLKERTPVVMIRLGHKAPADTAVVLDGTTLPHQSLNVEMNVDPGDHALLARAAGREDRKYSITLALGQKLELAVEPGGPAKDPLKPAGTPEARGATGGATLGADSSGPPPPMLGYVVGGAGLASLGASLVTGLVASGKESSLDDHCSDIDGKRRCDQEGLDAADSGRTFALVSTVTLGVGLVGVGVGTWLVFFRSNDGSTTAGARPIPGGATFEVRGKL